MLESLKDLSKPQLLHKRTINCIYPGRKNGWVIWWLKRSLQAQLFENSNKMNNEWIYLNEKPSLGLEISETALKKFGKLVYKK